MSSLHAHKNCIDIKKDLNIVNANNDFSTIHIPMHTCSNKTKSRIMNFLKILKSYFKKISLIYLLLISASPFLISLLIHLGFLIYASFAIWAWSDERPVIEDIIPGNILEEDKSKAGLEFQDMDLEDEFGEKDNKVEPVPELEYQPDEPDVRVQPEPKSGDDLEIISVQAAAIDSTWVIPSKGKSSLDAGSEIMARSFTRHIRSMREGGLDVVFVFDSTASMSGYLKEVKLKR
jgi:hypothetical protein